MSDDKRPDNGQPPLPANVVSLVGYPRDITLVPTAHFKRTPIPDGNELWVGPGTPLQNSFKLQQDSGITGVNPGRPPTVTNIAPRREQKQLARAEAELDKSVRNMLLDSIGAWNPFAMQDKEDGQFYKKLTIDRKRLSAIETADKEAIKASIKRVLGSWGIIIEDKRIQTFGPDDHFGTLEIPASKYNALEDYKKSLPKDPTPVR